MSNKALNFEEATIQKLKEAEQIGDTGYQRKILMAVPVEAIQNPNHNVRSYIKKMGEISREPSYGLPVEIEEETVQGVAVITIVMSYSAETDVEAVSRHLNK